MRKKIIKKILNSTPTKYNRIRNYVHALKKNIKITNKNDQKTILQIEKVLEETIKKLTFYNKITLFFYIIVYFSLVSYFLREIFLISKISIIISKIIGIFGTTIFFIAIYFSSKITDLYYQDLNLITANLISIYSKYQKEPIEEIPLQNTNYYKNFIEFFKKKGY